MYRKLPLFVLACLLAVSARAADGDRAPVPPAEEVEKATKLVRDLFKSEYAKTQPKAKAALAEKLFKQAEETNDDPVARYALYRESAELAAAAGDVTLTLEALGAIRTRYSGGKSEQDEPVLKAITARAPAADALTLANYLIRTVDDAVAADELEPAERLAALAVTAANRSKNVRASSVAAARVKEVEAFKKESAPIKEALKTLEKTPTNAAAALVAGKYYCFQRGEWEKGIPLFVVGNDAKLKALAEKEVEGSKEAADLLAVADGWYEAGTAAPAHHKRAALGRAFTFYAKAAPDLTGLNRTRADKRIEELERVVESRGPYDDLFAAVRTAVRGKDVEELAPLGGIFGRKDYRENGPSGGVLIGFNYGLRKVNNHDVVGYLQPIYMTPNGEKLGGAYGRAPAKPLVAKAKSGYAVGSLQITGGGLLESYTITFMRIQGKTLNPADKYDSPSMGREMAFGGRTVGDGRPVIGLHGKRTDGDEDICTIGLIVAGPKPAPPKK
ncbi:MAG: hypothetical protein J0I06_21415 [Planctomycetes bacterium]|nr:hypothetical protein [Planctomycetota bacterium]